MANLNQKQPQPQRRVLGNEYVSISRTHNADGSLVTGTDSPPVKVDHNQYVTIAAAIKSNSSVVMPTPGPSQYVTIGGDRVPAPVSVSTPPPAPSLHHQKTSSNSSTGSNGTYTHISAPVTTSPSSTVQPVTPTANGPPVLLAPQYVNFELVNNRSGNSQDYSQIPPVAAFDASANSATVVSPVRSVAGTTSPAVPAAGRSSPLTTVGAGGNKQYVNLEQQRGGVPAALSPAPAPGNSRVAPNDYVEFSKVTQVVTMAGVATPPGSAEKDKSGDYVSFHAGGIAGKLGGASGNDYVQVAPQPVKPSSSKKK